MTLTLPKGDSLDYRVISALAKKLERAFSSAREANLDDAVCLANYLFALDEADLARALLESFVFEVENNEERQDLWGAAANGLVLLAHIYRTSHPDKASRIVGILDDGEFQGSETTRYENFLCDLEDHQKNMDYAFTETPKYKCEVIGQEALNFLYYYEMIPVTREPLPEDFADTLRGLIDESYHHLRQALAESRAKGRKKPAIEAATSPSSGSLKDATTLFSGQLSVDYGQFYVDLIDEPDEDDYLTMDGAFHNQTNGLCGAAQKGRLFLVAGPQTGTIQVDVLLHSATPPMMEDFEDVVECSLRIPATDVGLCSWAHEETHKLDLPPGDYRVRYSIAGMDKDYAEDDEDVDAPIPGQKYLLQFWPGPPNKDVIVKLGSESATYWHPSSSG